MQYIDCLILQSTFLQFYEQTMNKLAYINFDLFIQTRKIQLIRKMRTNSKLPPLEHDFQTRSNFILSIQSKKKPFISSHQKSILTQFQSPRSLYKTQCKFFPVDQYKDFLKGEKIYLEVYYKDKVFISGYQPYIQAMGGEVTKRLTPSTTVILTNQMSEQNYQKLKTRIQKTCKSSVLVLSILWIQQIYRQKRKVQKQPFVFDQETDITDSNNQEQEDQDPMPDYFFNQIFTDLKLQFEQFKLASGNQKFIQIVDPKLIKDQKFPQFGFIIIDPFKTNIFQDEAEQKKYKDMRNNIQFKQFLPKNKQQKRKATNNYQQNLFKAGNQKDKKRRSTARMSQKIAIQRIQQKQEISKQEIQSQQQQEQKSSKQSDTQFLQRIKQQSGSQNLNQILSKYLSKDQNIKEDSKSESNIRNKNQSYNLSRRKKQNFERVTEQQNLDFQQSSQDNQHNFEIQKMEIEKQVIEQNQFNEKQFSGYYRPGDNTDRNIYQQDSQNFNQSNYQRKSQRRNEIQKKQNKFQNQDNEQNQITEIKQKINQDKSMYLTVSALERTKTAPKLHYEERKQKKSKYIQKYRRLILKFLKQVEYKFIKSQIPHDYCQNDLIQFNKKQVRNNNEQLIIFNVIAQDQMIIGHINQFNSAIKQKMSPQNQVYLQIIDFQTFNNKLNQNNIAHLFVNMQEQCQKLKQSKTKAQKFLRLQQMLQIQNSSEQQIQISHESFLEAISSSLSQNVRFYYICNITNLQDLVLSQVSSINKQNILQFNVVKQVYGYVSKINSTKNIKMQNSNSISNASRSQSLSNSSKDQAFMNSKKSQMINFKPQNNLSLKNNIEMNIFPQFIVQAQLRSQNIKNKAVSCVPSKVRKNVQLITGRLGGNFIKLTDYMQSKKKVQILVINSKKQFGSKLKSLWQPDYQSFLKSLIYFKYQIKQK